MLLHRGKAPGMSCCAECLIVNTTGDLLISAGQHQRVTNELTCVVSANCVLFLILLLILFLFLHVVCCNQRISAWNYSLCYTEGQLQAHVSSFILCTMQEAPTCACSGESVYIYLHLSLENLHKTKIVTSRLVNRSFVESLKQLMFKYIPSFHKLEKQDCD